MLNRYRSSIFVVSRCFIVLSVFLNLSSAILFPAETECGKSLTNTNLDGGVYWRIVGGRPVKRISDWPWQAYINITIKYTDIMAQNGCGAAIIHEEWLLTAAHCVYEFYAHDYNISVSIEAIMGTVDLFSSSKNDGRRSRKVVKVITHPKFDFSGKINDIALLKLDSKLDFHGNDSHLKPVCLPKLSQNFSTNCFATGYGYQDQNMMTDDFKLKMLPEKMTSVLKCREHFSTVNIESNICIGGVAKQGTCKGDSGSPLQCYHPPTKQWYQMGLISYGQPCAFEHIPDVLTRIAYFHDWILEQS